MDPVTAAILISMVVSVGAGMLGAESAEKERRRVEQEQERLRVDQVRAEIGTAAQKTSTALGAAGKRPTTNMQPSFASAALTGNQSSNTSVAKNSPTSASGSSGTF